MDPQPTPLDLFHATSAGSWIAVGVLVGLILFSIPGFAEAIAKGFANAVGLLLVAVVPAAIAAGMVCMAVVGFTIVALVSLIVVCILVMWRRDE